MNVLHAAPRAARVGGAAARPRGLEVLERASAGVDMHARRALAYAEQHAARRLPEREREPRERTPPEPPRFGRAAGRLGRREVDAVDLELEARGVLAHPPPRRGRRAVAVRARARARLHLLEALRDERPQVRRHVVREQGDDQRDRARLRDTEREQRRFDLVRRDDVTHADLEQLIARRARERLHEEALARARRVLRSQNAFSRSSSAPAWP